MLRLCCQTDTSCMPAPVHSVLKVRTLSHSGLADTALGAALADPGLPAHLGQQILPIPEPVKRQRLTRHHQPVDAGVGILTQPGRHRRRRDADTDAGLHLITGGQPGRHRRSAVPAARRRPSRSVSAPRQAATGSGYRPQSAPAPHRWPTPAWLFTNRAMPLAGSWANGAANAANNASRAGAGQSPNQTSVVGDAQACWLNWLMSCASAACWRWRRASSNASQAEASGASERRSRKHQFPPA